jgi:hypothetical protein
MNDFPSMDNDFLAPFVKLLADSYEHFTRQKLIDANSATHPPARAIFEADFVVLSSGTESDPLFNYANRCALELFELDWQGLIELPARESAEPVHQDARAELMQRVIDHGYISDYSGTRVSASGKRFIIQQATVWNVIDAGGTLHGQAATFSTWTDI